MIANFNEKFDLTMVVTYQHEQRVINFLKSIEDNEKIKLFVILLNQETFFRFNHNNFNNKIITIDIPKSSLSKARNIGIEYLKQNDAQSDYIMFPDDDTTFDLYFFLNFKKATITYTCFITPIYNEGSKVLYIGSLNKYEFKMKISDLSLVGSPNQIILYNKLKNELFFDESLGLGAKYGSSEDMDFYIRLLIKGEVFIYTNKLYTFHPKKVSNYYGKSLMDIIRRFRNYSYGYAFLITKYNLNFLIPNYLFRTLAASLYFLFKLKFKLTLAYFYQLFMRIYFIVYFILNRICKSLK